MWTMYRGLPALVDLATMRDVVCRFDKDPDLVNFSCPVSLIVDHSPSVEFSQRCVSKRSRQFLSHSEKTALTLLVWQQDGHPACKKLLYFMPVVSDWRFTYPPPPHPTSLPQQNPELTVTCRLIQVVLNYLR